MDSTRIYLNKIPEEILVKILSYLKTYDILHYCEAFTQYRHLLHERKLIRTVDFSMEFRLKIPLMDCLMPHINPSYVTVFNVCGLYWMPAEELRSCISQFSNLESLCVLDTEMCVSEADALCLASLTKIQKIAINMNKRCLTLKAFQCFPAVKSLLLYLVGNETRYPVEMLTSKLHTLDLWIISESTYFNITSVEILFEMGLKRFVCHTISSFRRVLGIPMSIPRTDLSSSALSFNYINARLDLLCIDRSCGHPKLDPTAYDESFQKFHTIWSQINNASWYYMFPFGFEDTKMLLRRDPPYRIKELHFEQYPANCSAEYCSAIVECLNSPMTGNLQRLSFNCCYCRPLDQETNSNASENDKGQRLVCHPLKQVGDNFPNLTELAIFKLCRCPNRILNLDYETISNLKYLKKLTLCVMKATPPQFIVNVLQKCTQLEVLKIECTENKSFMDSLFAAIQFAKKLKDFRCEVILTPLNVDGLFEGLGKSIERELQRLAVIADESDISSTSNIAEFLEKNPQLLFLGLFITDISVRHLGEIRKYLHDYKMVDILASSKKIYEASRSQFVHYDSIPTVHLREMFYSPIHVLTCDVFNDFMLSDYVC